MWSSLRRVIDSVARLAGSCHQDSRYSAPNHRGEADGVFTGLVLALYSQPSLLSLIPVQDIIGAEIIQICGWPFQLQWIELANDDPVTFTWIEGYPPEQGLPGVY